MRARSRVPGYGLGCSCLFEVTILAAARTNSLVQAIAGRLLSSILSNAYHHHQSVPAFSAATLARTRPGGLSRGGLFGVAIGSDVQHEWALSADPRVHR